MKLYVVHGVLDRDTKEVVSVVIQSYMNPENYLYAERSDIATSEQTFFGQFASFNHPGKHSVVTDKYHMKAPLVSIIGAVDDWFKLQFENAREDIGLMIGQTLPKDLLGGIVESTHKYITEIFTLSDVKTLEELTQPYDVKISECPSDIIVQWYYKNAKYFEESTNVRLKTSIEITPEEFNISQLCLRENADGRLEPVTMSLTQPRDFLVRIRPGKPSEFCSFLQIYMDMDLRRMVGISRMLAVYNYDQDGNPTSIYQIPEELHVSEITENLTMNLAFGGHPVLHKSYRTWGKDE